MTSTPFHPASGCPTPQDFDDADAWYSSAFSPAALRERLPFSFVYDGEKIHSQPECWDFEWGETICDGPVRRSVYVLSDPQSDLACRCELERYDDFPAVEWVLHFRNHGNADSPILSEILPLDTTWFLEPSVPCLLAHSSGSQATAEDFAYRQTELLPGAECTLESIGGRSSDGALPFYNLLLDRQGVIGAIGWSGNWRAQFQRDAESLSVSAGMKKTQLRLRPGEEIRTPRILQLLWRGEPMHAHNLLRRFLLAHHTPHIEGQPPRKGLRSLVTWGENSADRHIEKIHWLRENHIPLDNYWIDAGWHGQDPWREDATVFNSNWHAYVGHWIPNPTAYPQGLAPVGEAAAKANMGLTLWFEPERIVLKTQFAHNREWLLGPGGKWDSKYLLDLGNPDARQAITDAISTLITEGGITCFRQDFNMEPEVNWAQADAPDRVGMTEIRHIEGLYEVWDELRRRHPGLLIDNCASGGRRLDLELISRSVALWRSDFQCNTGFSLTGMQSQTHGLSLWMPITVGCCDHQDDYAFRSALAAGMSIITPVNESGRPEGFETPWQTFTTDWLRQRVAELQRVQPYFEGDFYPLLGYSLAEDVWAAWQFDRPDLNAGILLAFRRERCPSPTLNCSFRGLDSDANYDVRCLDDESTIHASGETLHNSGLEIVIPAKRDSRLYLYRRI